jgi:hypothetical protein
VMDTPFPGVKISVPEGGFSYDEPMPLTPAHCDLCNVDTFAEIMAYHSRRHVSKLMARKRAAERRYEYRVRWRREGGRWVERGYKTFEAAHRMLVKMRDNDEAHWLCDDYHDRCLKPLVAGPEIQRRYVGSWEDRGIHGFIRRDIDLNEGLRCMG